MKVKTDLGVISAPKDTLFLIKNAFWHSAEINPNISSLTAKRLKLAARQIDEALAEDGYFKEVYSSCLGTL